MTIMLNQEWDRFGDEIRRTVQNAVDSQNFEKLNQTITNTVNKTMDSARNFTAVSLKPKKDITEHLFKKVSIKKMLSVFLMVLGIPIAFVMFIMLVTSLFFTDFTTGVMAAASTIVLIVFGFLFLAGMYLVVAGARLSGSIKRFLIYKEEAKVKQYFDIKNVAGKIGKTKKYVLKDLKKMINKRWFLQGHIDEQNTCFIASDDMFRQYNEMMQSLKSQIECEKKEREKKTEEQKKQDGMDPKVRDIVNAGEEYICKIRECNDRIKGEDISNKISRIEILADKIFDRVESDPRCIGDIRKLMDYYLPTTVKLLEAYAELDEMDIQGENIISSKKEIEKTLDTLNVAFEKLLDSLFQEKAWDVSADISVLNTMLAQEGLTKEDF